MVGSRELFLRKGFFISTMSFSQVEFFSFFEGIVEGGRLNRNYSFVLGKFYSLIGKDVDKGNVKNIYCSR